MKKYLSMIFFVILLGLVASAILIGMDLLTAERIKANQEIELSTSILNAFQIDYEPGQVNAVFDESIETITIDDLVYYKSMESGAIGYRYEGAGVWGPIIGFIAFEEDFQTIRSITVLQQEETPGLGGVVADPNYLAQFSGIIFDPDIEINKDTNENKANEVDAITGATRTSEAFELMLNTQYQRYKSAYQE